MIASTSHTVGGGADMPAEDPVPSLVFAFMFMVFQVRVLVQSSRSIFKLMMYYSSKELPDKNLIGVYDKMIKKPQLSLEAKINTMQDRVENNIRKREDQQSSAQVQPLP